jgi:hypothetical protein
MATRISPGELTDEMKNQPSPEDYELTDEDIDFVVKMNNAQTAMDELVTFMYNQGKEDAVLRKLFNDLELWIEGYFGGQ